MEYWSDGAMDKEKTYFKISDGLFLTFDAF
jgi:hypothetical protein